ncbi:MAG: amidophosphoribosyltransferase [SAR324 cluster bacterium]|nr:amidophosphoribosyltransferase [SAR324 cluster bacterium]
MPEALHEECGIVAVYQLDQATAKPVNAAKYVPDVLLDIQNRGQLSAGLTSYNPKRDRLLQTHKGLGSVEQAFRLYNSQKYDNLMKRFKGTAAIGHVRYATSGQENLDFAQPFERVHGRKWKWFSFCFNGNLANFDVLKKQLIASEYNITYNTDTEVMMHFINRELRGDGRKSYKEVFASLSKIFDGAFTIAFLNACGDLVVMRDPLGIKPLCYGIKDNLLVVSSESIVLNRMGVDYQDIEPGTLLIATREGGYQIERYHKKKKTAHCHFEWVYFANLASNLDRRSVFKARRLMGRLLAEMEDEKYDINARVVPIPETAKIAGNAFGFKLGIPVIEGLARNRYVGRTFIEGGNRQAVIRRKFTPIRELLSGKKVFLVDDSLVRAVTLKTIIEDLRIRGKVQEIHVRIACPTIIAPCFYGINIPTVQELFATKFWQPGQPLKHSKKTLNAMAKELGADSLKFLTIDRLVQAIGFPKNQLCTACINTKYPTPTGTEKYQQQVDMMN